MGRSTGLMERVVVRCSPSPPSPAKGVRRVRHARNVVMAIGYYDHPVHIGVPGEDLPHVHHYYGEPHPHYRQRVVIVGGGNSAAESALEMYRAGAHVTVVHRAPTLKPTIKYWVRPDIENRIKEGSIAAHFSAVVREIRAGSVVIAPAEDRPLRLRRRTWPFRPTARRISPRRRGPPWRGSGDPGRRRSTSDRLSRRRGPAARRRCHAERSRRARPHPGHVRDKCVGIVRRRRRDRRRGHRHHLHRERPLPRREDHRRHRESARLEYAASATGGRV